MRSLSSFPAGLICLALSAVFTAAASNESPSSSTGGKEVLRSDLPFRIIETSGAKALQQWEQLKKSSDGYPVIIGGEEDLSIILDSFDTSFDTADFPQRSVEEILSAAANLTHPESFRAYLKDQDEKLEALLAQQQEEALRKNNDPDEVSRREAARVEASRLAEQLEKVSGNQVSIIPADELNLDEFEEVEPEVGDWPLFAPAPAGLSVVRDVLTGKYLEKAYIIVVPTKDWTEIPAYLRWGDWNENPPPEFHVSAFRSWRDRYGAELIGISGEVLNLRVKKKPRSRQEALDLARELYDYDKDIVDQGVETLSNLAAALKAYEWWYFWWD